jgi:uncharacterized protein
MTSAKNKVGLRALARKIQEHYGKRLIGVYRVDSAMPYDTHERPDEDIVVVLADGPWRVREEEDLLSDLTYDVMVETDLFALAWAVSKSLWENPAGAPDEMSLRSMKASAESLMDMAHS